jgi:hypothetical protein
VNNKLEMVRNKGVLAYFEILSQHLPEMTDENHESYQAEYCVSGPLFPDGLKGISEN